MSHDSRIALIRDGVSLSRLVFGALLRTVH